ncbi:MAG TPA: DUF362 domain-containing protein [Bryobacteraceae bacterium]|nr:DUF362 domain-containing protein [Bryobacteraceae bacterium]
MERENALHGVGLAFQEAMVGAVADRPLSFDARIRTGDLERFLNEPEHRAELTGTVTCPDLGGTMPVRDGSFQLFAVEAQKGMRQLRYSFRFTGRDGGSYFLDGHKDIHDDPGLDVVKDLTCLYTDVHRGEDEHAPLYGHGELHSPLAELPAMLASMKVEGAHGWSQDLAARAAFASFVWGQLRDEYLDKARLFYDTRYENLVVAGRLRASWGEAPFFLVSGVHDKGFPWGDGELFWDVLLAVADSRGGYRRYAITDRVLTGLRLDIGAGTYRYSGPLYSLEDSYAASFSEMRKGAPRLAKLSAEITLEFQATPSDAVAFPFPLVKPVVRKLSAKLQRELREALPGENAPGIFITPNLAAVRGGSITVDGESWEVDPAATAGECEQGAFRNVKEPTLLYGYLCALRPERRSACVQISSRTLRNEKQDWVKDRLDAVLGAAVARMSSAEIRMQDGACTVKPLPPAGRPEDRAVPLRKIGAPIVEVNNDHFPTAVFQRRIVEVEDAAGERCLALEEDMRAMRLEAVGCDRQTRVAAIRGDDPLRALDCVLDATGFDTLLDERLRASNKDRAAFSIAIKPNFMFSYDKRDRTTYTDPQLVGRLVQRLRERGFASIHVVEAQCTYGEFFDKRGVREMADYLGYNGQAGYDIVDMTLDADEARNLGPHLGMHPVSRVWREADFRISFAKNKTHSYAYYTLTLKNIYGALPLANKFREYHCRRDIYHTTMEYLSAFPVHFGLIDAWLSADGPFGVFADPAPNETRTVIGGADLVAVDWVGASKMGIDPMISKFMELAVGLFGKPAIDLIGDANPYRPWLNVPAVVSLAAHKGMDAEYDFGNLIYAVSAQMDDSHFRCKNNTWYIRLLRTLTVPMRRAFFLRTGEAASAANRFLSWLFYRLGY